VLDDVNSAFLRRLATAHYTTLRINSFKNYKYVLWNVVSAPLAKSTMTELFL